MAPEAAETGRASPHARYRMAEELARKGPLRVVTAHDLLLNRTVAMAICGGTNAQRSTFIRQSQTVARSSSQFVVDIYDSGSYDDGLFVVFERPAYTLAEVIGAGEEAGIARVGLVDAARELEEAILCLRLAGVDLGNLRPEVVGVNEAGHVRLSPWPLCSADAGAKVPRPVTGDTVSDGERILALLAPASGASTQDSAAMRKILERPKETVNSASLIGTWVAGCLDGLPPERPFDPAATAQVMVDRSVLSRPMITSHMAKRRRPRSHHLAVASAAIVAIATLGVASFLMSQPGVAGIRDRSPAAAATSKAGTSTLMHSATGRSSGSPLAPVLSPATNDLPMSRQGPLPPVPGPTPLVTPATNVVSSSAGQVAPTAAGTPATTTTTTAPATTTTTTAPATTTTTMPPPPGAPAP
jgi:hypothetical protein